MRILRNPLFYIILLLLTTGCFLFMRSHFQVLCNDETTYAYVLDTDTINGYWREDGVTEVLTTFDQVISSQINHYNFANGRVLVHGIEQLFTGIIGLDAYYLLNSVFCILLISLSVYLNSNKSSRKNYLFWLLVTIIFIYLFPEPNKLWISVNLGPNYLLPGLLMTIVFVLFKHFKTIQSNKIKIFCAIITCIIFGASHEVLFCPCFNYFGRLLYYKFQTI